MLDAFRNSEILEIAQIILNKIDTKVDKVTGKQLSDENYTLEEKQKLNNIENQANKTIVDSTLSATSTNPIQNKKVKEALDTKVDKETGKGLSEANFTSEEKAKLSNIETEANKTIIDSSLNANSTNPVQNKKVKEALDTKVDKEAGKGLSEANFTTTEKTKLSNIEEEANKTIIDDTVNSSTTHAISPNAVSTAIIGVTNNMTVTIEKQNTADNNFFATYVIKQGGAALSPKINIPKDFLLKSVSLETASSAISGTNIVAGDKYFDFEFNTKDNSESSTHSYLNVKDLSDEYSADESSITMDANNVFSVKAVDTSKVVSSTSNFPGINPPPTPSGTPLTQQHINAGIDITLSMKESLSNKVRQLSNSTEEYPSCLAVTEALDDKVDTVQGKGLSTNDFTDAYKDKLDSLDEGGNGVTYISLINEDLTLYIGTEDPASIVVTSDKDILQTEEECTIQAVVKDKDDNVLEGVPIDFEFEHNGTVIDTVSVITNLNGICSTTYTGTGAGDIDVTAKFGSLLQETYELQDLTYYNSGSVDKSNTISHIIKPNYGSMEYDSENKYYIFKKTTSNDYTTAWRFCSLPFNDCEVSLDFYIQSRTDTLYNGFLWIGGVSEQEWANHVEIGTWGQNKILGAVVNNSASNRISVSPRLPKNNWYTLYAKFENGSVTSKIIDTSTQSVLAEKTSACFNMETMYVDLNLIYNTSINYVKNIKIKAL